MQKAGAGQSTKGRGIAPLETKKPTPRERPQVTAVVIWIWSYTFLRTKASLAMKSMRIM